MDAIRSEGREINRERKYRGLRKGEWFKQIIHNGHIHVSLRWLYLTNILRSTHFLSKQSSKASLCHSDRFLPCIYMPMIRTVYSPIQSFYPHIIAPFKTTPPPISPMPHIQ